LSILQTIKERRSTVAFKKEPVDLAILKEIFTYGSYAPSHYMSEAWRIHLYQGEGKKQLADAIIHSYQRTGMLSNENTEKARKSRASIADFLLTIPHHALIYYEQPENKLRNEEEYSSVAAFIQNCQLAAWEYDVGVLWTITPYMHDEAFIKEVGLDPKKHKISAVLQMGYPEKTTRDKGRTPVEEFMKIIN
jgi:nitroreductase